MRWAGETGDLHKFRDQLTRHVKWWATRRTCPKPTPEVAPWPTRHACAVAHVLPHSCTCYLCSLGAQKQVVCVPRGSEHAVAQNPSISLRHTSCLQPSWCLIPVPTLKQEAKNKSDRMAMVKMKLQDSNYLKSLFLCDTHPLRLFLFVFKIYE